MSIEEYWIGRGIDYQAVWQSYEDGFAYIEKFRTMRVHLLQIELRELPLYLPLFNHEAVYKTIKGYFHDLKQQCLSRDEYSAAGPLFLYSVERASGIWSFLGELPQLLLLGATLADEKVMGQQLENLDMKLSILRKYFGEATVSRNAFQAFMCANTPSQLQIAVDRLISEGIDKIQISSQPFDGDIDATKRSLFNIKELFMGDQYNVGQAAAVGKYARSDNNTFLQSEPKQTLSKAAAEIQQLLKQLEQSNTTATEEEKIAYVNDETTPSFKRRVVGALQKGGEAVIEEFFDDPYVNVGKAVVKGWMKPE